MKSMEKYHESISRNYHALCLDVDGTITINNGTDIEENILEKIYTLVKKGVPVVFVTGRGQTGLNNIIENIISYIENNKESSYKCLNNIHFLINDGAIYYKFDEKSKKFTKKEILISEYAVKEIAALNMILEKLMETKLNEIVDVTYSLNDNDLINIRIKEFKSKFGDKFVENIIENLIKDTELNLTIGYFKENKIFQIGGAKKEIAIDYIEKVLGIPKNSMIRIGDCGDEKGNDYSMLNCSQGFTVKHASKAKSKCFDIYNDNNELLTGVEATKFLLNQVNLVKSICLEAADYQIYLKDYSKIEKEINLGRKKILQKYDERINRVYDGTDGIYSLFDKNSGSIIIPMYEWELMEDDNALKQLYNEKDIFDNLAYALRDNNSFLLRGASNYYYFLANRVSININGKEKDYTDVSNVYYWFQNNLIFFEKSVDAINETQEVNSIVNKKLILGVLDNLRNFLLIFINANITTKYSEKTAMLRINKVQDELYPLYKVLKKTLKLMFDISFDSDFNINYEKLTNLIKKSVAELIKSNEKNGLIGKDCDYSKIFRAYREIDNFGENIISSIISKENTKNDIIDVLGLTYGGIELPILYELVDQNVNDIYLFKFTEKLSSYSKKHEKNLLNLNINNLESEEICEFESKPFMVFDDNLLTGKTMQLVLNTMNGIGIDVKNVSVVRYPSVNRISQMFLKGHGAVDFNAYFNFIVGLGFPSPYTWRDENLNSEYEDSLGIFDVNRQKILECIYKNHSYNENSEVAKIRRKKKI